MENKDNSGISFKNDDKQSSSHADMNGTALIDGAEYWMNTWFNTSKNGKKYMKHTFKRKESAKQQKSGFDDNDLPF